MDNLTEIAKKLDDYRGKKESYSMTHKRMLALRRTCSHIKAIMDFNAAHGVTQLTSSDYESLGLIQHSLDTFFPDGNIPEPLRNYSRFVQAKRTYAEGAFDETLEAKLARDDKALKAASREDTRADRTMSAEIDDPVYARFIVNVIEADLVKPEQNRVAILYAGEPLYEEEIPDFAFAGLPKGTRVVFDYTSQGLELKMPETLKDVKERAEVERIVRESIAQNFETQKYLDDVLGDVKDLAK